MSAVVHHLNCGTMRLPGAPLVCHVLLIEGDDGLALVDTGYGLGDIADPSRLGSSRHVIRPALDPAETAAHQVEALGYQRHDVTHILLTHLDSDHAGGLADFPSAQVHTTAAEWAAANHRRGLVERTRYCPAQWAHGPRLITHDAAGETWRGFAAATSLEHIAPGLLIIPLPGHTRGHAAYALDRGDTWLLHAGDTFYHHSTIDGAGRQPTALKTMERRIAHDWKRVLTNQARLRELHQHDPAVTIVSAHDPHLLDHARATAPAPRPPQPDEDDTP